MAAIVAAAAMLRIGSGMTRVGLNLVGMRPPRLRCSLCKPRKEGRLEKSDAIGAGREEAYLDVSSDGVVAGEGARTVGAGDADALVALADVGPEVGLVAVGALAERAAQLGA